MMAVYVILIPLAVIPVVVLVWCAAFEAFMMKERPRWSWLPPLGTGLAAAWCFHVWDASYGMEALAWLLPMLYGQSAFAGALAGAVIGALLRWLAAHRQAKEMDLNRLD